MDSLEIQVDVNESFINLVTAGQPVEATLNAYPDWKIPGSVIAIIPTADRSKATVKVRIALGSKDSRIVPDMGVRVAFLGAAGRKPTAPEPGVLVPAEAVRGDGASAVVFVVAGDKVERRSVTLGRTVGANRQVLSGAARRRARGAGAARVAQGRRRHPAGREELMGPPPTDALIQIRGVTKTYRRGSEKIEVLHGIDLDIPRGDFVALMGPSGSGKTTLLNLIGGLDSADARARWWWTAGASIASRAASSRAGGPPTSGSCSSSTTCCPRCRRRRTWSSRCC